MIKRSSGILLHVTSLPAKFGIGDLGPWAYRFAEFLANSNQRFWQILPLNPTNPISGNSPYSSSSAFAGNTILISPDLLQRSGLIESGNLQNIPGFPSNKVSFQDVIEYKSKLFKIAFQNFLKKSEQFDNDYSLFLAENKYWLEDFASFIAFKNFFQGKAWCDWPAEIRDRDPEALERLKKKLDTNIHFEIFLQFLFNLQWKNLKEFCNDRGIKIIGDMPYYISYDSADVWMNPGAYKLDNKKRPTHVAGVPPDYFSATGQLWGNPIYRWDVMQQNGYIWWIERIKQNLKSFDLVRVDHFRGLVAYWEVPAEEETAIKGKWVNVPTEDFFNNVNEIFPDSPIIAEDLGVITDDVKGIIQKYGIPGMKVLIFAFDENLPRNPYAPHNHDKNFIVYTGTHDNNTVRGWFENKTTPEIRKRMFKYLGREIASDQIHWEFIRMAYSSVANIAIVPMQDILGLGEEAKMNRPATLDGNWQWRFEANQITTDLSARLREMIDIYGRG